ncbi:MAG: hypothetical protein FD146_449 [Anaerolineaceae bacterium]|nr:MAG: hypothetical protein FD146_449 [Anaerolineaceae bacterium]
MKTKLSKAFVLLLVVLVQLAAFVPAHAAGQSGETALAPLPSLNDFVASVKDGSANTVRGVYVPGKFALPVIQQPEGKGGYVSRDDGVVTQYGYAARKGTVGLLAHNYLAGSKFTTLAAGQIVQIVYGDGRIVNYEIAHVYRYQALQPNSASSILVNLDDNKQYTAWDVFQKVYTGGDHVTFQTCIEANGELSWGRLFVVALPYVDEANPSNK